MKFSLAHADCVDWLRSLPSESVDLCVTDPAYESLEKHRAKGTTTRLSHSKSSSNDWFAIFRNERFPELLSELYRVLKDDSHLYVICDQETAFDVVKPMARGVGFTWWKALVWLKTKKDSDDPSAGMGYHYRASFEHVCFLEKGKRKLNDLGICDVLTAPRVRGGYPTEKPVSLLRTLIEQSSSVGDVVIDPFTGSGSCGEAALVTGRSFAGCDVSSDARDRAAERLKSVGGEWVRNAVPQPIGAAQQSLFGGAA
jgi:site-specific DNA-methyltransferase (adenine-specific)